MCVPAQVFPQRVVELTGQLLLLRASTVLIHTHLLCKHTTSCSYGHALCVCVCVHVCVVTCGGSEQDLNHMSHSDQVKEVEVGGVYHSMS